MLHKVSRHLGGHRPEGGTCYGLKYLGLRGGGGLTHLLDNFTPVVWAYSWRQAVGLSKRWVGTSSGKLETSKQFYQLIVDLSSIING